jgi:hypothetical protein
MHEHETSAAIFMNGTEDAPVFVRLEETGQTINSIASTTKIGLGPTAVAYYIKQFGDGLEYRQLSMLRERGVSVPADVMRSADGSKMATSYAGTPLQKYLQAAPKHAADTLRGVGQTLREIHETLNDGAIPDEVLARTYLNTSHIVDDFYYKYAGPDSGFTLEEYQRHKNILQHGGYDTAAESVASVSEKTPFVVGDPSFPPAMRRLVDTANAAADRYAAQLAPFLGVRQPLSGPSSAYLHIIDQALCYGDFKPANILVSDDAGQQISVIDPIISRGSTYFDLAKFTARYLLEYLEADQAPPSLKPFFDGYGIRPSEDLKLYGPFTFSDLVGVDLLNICRAYVRRYSAGIKTFRITRLLDSPAFCDRLTGLIGSVASIRDTHQLDQLTNGQVV